MVPPGVLDLRERCHRPPGDHRGIGYTGGAIAYGLKRPNLVPGWFGFHELFHAGTVIGYVCHAAAIGLAVLAR
ncbi:hemolysin III family protein [Ruania alba]|uniref:hemolysin III family protein n=1 Tax=Ruania alba TaxID=648782 RepID=UPI0031844979